MEEYLKKWGIPCLVCYDLRISTTPSRWHRGPEWFEPQRKLARELTGRDPFDDEERLFVEAKSLDATAEAGCPSCAFLREIWGRLCHTEQLCSGEGDMEGRQGFFLYYPIDEDPDDQMPRVLFLRLQGCEYVIHTMEGTVSVSDQLGAHFKLKTDEKKNLGESCPWDVISSLPWSSYLLTPDQVGLFVQKAFSKRLSYLQPLYSEISPKVPVLPTRLVMLHDDRPQGDLGTGAPLDIRLLETSSIAQTSKDDARYVALSHCWGSQDVAAQVMQTTRATIAAFSQSIPWGGLTKTFQDAMLVTKHLGIRYIWIDSLCIVQDDAQDWAAEASQMASVYKNAHLTIAAAGALDGNQGLFINKDSKPILRRGVHKIELPGLQYPIYVRRYVPEGDESRSKDDNSLEGLDEWPLLRRCWAFQERLLSPSILHFTKDELILEDDSVRNHRLCECRELDHSIPGSGAGRHLLLDERDVSLGLRSWCSIVENYAWRLLTSEADRLPALSGVATAFQRRGPPLGSYLAGLWESDIYFQLHWKTKGPVQPRLKPILSRKTLLSAPPTWSWASVGRSNIEWPRFSASEYLVEIISVTCSPLTSDDKGMVAGGRITLRGRLSLAVLSLSTHGSTTNAGEYSVSLINDSMANYAPASFSPDIELFSTAGVLPAVHFLPLSIHQDQRVDEPWVLQGLVLCRETKEVSATSQVDQSMNETATFSRVGCAVVIVEPEIQDWLVKEYWPALYATDPTMHEVTAWPAEWRNTVFDKFGQEQVLTII